MHSLLSRGLVLLVLAWMGAAHAANGQPRGRLDLPLPGLRVDSGPYSVVFRPPSAEYRRWKGDRFELIYQAGAEEMAHRTRAALRSSWPATDSLVGPVAADFDTPVVINAYSDRGNGYVSPLPFRQEIEAVSNKTDQLVARSSTWPALVASHELVHSAHADVQAGVGVGGLIHLFAPDVTRALNLTAPLGLVEGVAVHRESRIEPEAGRLHAPLFTMKMKAAMLSDDPWTFTQMMEAPAYSQPYNRHYIAGSHAFEYLADRGDSTSTEFFRDAVTWHNRFPFLGHGVWLGFATGETPAELTTNIRSGLEARYAAELDRRRPFTPLTVVAGEEGLNHRRPYWLDDETLVAYVHGYDVRPGFYRIDATTGRRTPIRVQTLTEDRRYSLGRDTSFLYASRYVQDALVPTQQIAEIERVNLQSGEATRLTDQGRALAPAEGPDGRLHAVTNDGPFTRWSVRTAADTLRPLTPDGPTSVRQVAPAPIDDRIAVLINAGGDQRLYRTTMPQQGRPRLEPWIGLEGAIIYDVSWGPKGRYLLFAADHPETATIFAFDTETNRVLQLAKVPFGALEPALSPDRSTLAFVNYRHERHDLVRIPFRPDSATVVPDSMVQLSAPAPRSDLLRSSRPVDSVGPSPSYSAWRHLAPRMVYPTISGEVEDWDQYVGPGAEPLALGVGVVGSDPLRRWAYRGRAYWQDGRLWGEARMESGRFLLRPSLAAYNRSVVPSYESTPGIEERGIGLGLRLPVILQSNVYQSLLRMGVETRLRQTRRYGGPLTRPTSFSNRLTFNPRVTFGYRLQQNPRDLVPNTGLVLGVEGEFDTWVEDLRAGAVGRRKAVSAGLNAYLPPLRATHTGIRLGIGFLTQNRPTLGTSTVVPRGFDVPILGGGSYLRLGAEVTQPLWYIDDGISIVPLYAKALSIYGFGETQGRVTRDGWHEARTSVGGGVSLRARFFYVFDFDFRIGLAYRAGPGDVQPIFR